MKINTVLLIVSWTAVIFSIFLTLYCSNKKKKPDGTLTVDPFGDDPPIRLNLKLNMDELMERKYIVLKVDARTFISFDISAEVEKPKD